jgi:hypothetical protein
VCACACHSLATPQNSITFTAPTVQDNGLWTMGGDSYADFLRRTAAYSLASLADRITAPSLIMDAEDDQFLHGQPSALAAAMTAPVTMARFTTAEGAGEHCHVGSLTRAHQVMFDWLVEAEEEFPGRGLASGRAS